MYVQEWIAEVATEGLPLLLAIVHFETGSLTEPSDH